MNKLAEKILNFAVELTEVKSIVGTAGERDSTQKVWDRLSEMSYFKEHPDQLYFVDVDGDSLKRNSVLAMVKGNKEDSQKTVVMIGHTDTVGTSDYGEIEAFATRPHELPDKYSQVHIPEDASKDLASGEYLFGRGIFDMKTGVSTLVHVLEVLSEQVDELEGNVILAAVCDEEGNSGGMLQVVPELLRLQKEHGFEYQAMLDTDYSAPRFEGDQTRYLYIGTVGKLMPSFYVVGSEAHSGDPFRGIDPNHISSAIMEEMDYNMEYAEEAEGEVTVPPSSLRQKDLKPEYSVQTAKTSFVYFNFSTHTSTPDELLEKVRAGANKAFQKVVDRLTEQYRIYAKRSGFEFHELPWKARVLTYAELLDKVKAERGEEVDQRLDELQQRLLADPTIDERDHAMQMVAQLHSLWSDQEPVVIAYYSPPYYPHIYVKDEMPKEKALLQAVEKALDNCDSDYDIQMRKFYPYISDLSYAAAPREAGAVESLQDNMPGFGVKYRLPLEEMRQLNLPVVNIGPFGKDAHKFTERVQKDYSYHVAPMLVLDTVKNLLD